MAEERAALSAAYSGRIFWLELLRKVLMGQLTMVPVDVENAESRRHR